MQIQNFLPTRFSTSQPRSANFQPGASQVIATAQAVIGQGLSCCNENTGRGAQTERLRDVWAGEQYGSSESHIGRFLLFQSSVVRIQLSNAVGLFRPHPERYSSLVTNQFSGTRGMSITVEATYEHGTLKPVQPLDLAEGARVRLTIEDSAIQAGALLDPLADVIGIGDSGRTDGADKHDKYIYGTLRS